MRKRRGRKYERRLRNGGGESGTEQSEDDCKLKEKKTKSRVRMIRGDKYKREERIKNTMNEEKWKMKSKRGADENTITAKPRAR